MLIHKDLANFLAHHVLRQAHGALPAIALLRGARERGAIELEVLTANLLGKVRRAGEQDVPRGPQLPIRHTADGKQALEVLKVGGHHGHHAVLGQAPTVQDGTGNARQLIDVHRVVRLHRIAGGHHIPVPGRDLFLQSHDAGCSCLRAEAKEARWVKEAQHGFHMLLVSGEDLSVGLLAVVGLIGQTQAGLNNVGHRLLGAGVLLHPERHRSANALALEFAQVVGQLFRGGGNQLV